MIKILKTFSDKKHEITLLLLISFHLLNILEWFNLKLWPRGKAWHCHVINFGNMIETLNKGSNFFIILLSNQENPPLFYLVAMALKSIFRSNRAIFFSASVFLVILIVIVYLIGKYFRDKEVGLLAAVICSFSPLIYSSAIVFNLELATVAIVSLVIYVLVTKNFLLNKYDAFFLGATLGLAALTRSFFVCFVIGPFFVIFKKLYEDVNNKRKIIKINILPNLLITFSIFFSIAIIFYHQQEFYLKLFHKVRTADSDANWAYHLFFYIEGLFRQLGLLGVVGFIASLFTLKKIKKEKALLLAWIVVPFLFLFISPRKNVYYMSSLVPPMAIVFAIGISSIRNIFLKRVISTTVVIVLISFYFKSF